MRYSEANKQLKEFDMRLVRAGSTTTISILDAADYVMMSIGADQMYRMNTEDGLDQYEGEIQAKVFNIANRLAHTTIETREPELYYILRMPELEEYGYLNLAINPNQSEQVCLGDTRTSSGRWKTAFTWKEILELENSYNVDYTSMAILVIAR